MGNERYESNEIQHVEVRRVSGTGPEASCVYTQVYMGTAGNLEELKEFLRNTRAPDGLGSILDYFL